MVRSWAHHAKARGLARLCQVTSTCQRGSFSKSLGPVLRAMRRVLVVLVGLLALVPVLAIGVIEVRTRAGIPELEEEFASYTPPRIAELGSTKTLSILPLIDWHTRARQ